MSNEQAIEHTLPLIRIGINEECNKCRQCPMYGFGIKKV